MHRCECMGLCLCERTGMCWSLCTVWLSDVHVLCSGGALLGAAFSIVLEQAVSTYYTSQMVQRTCERERGGERWSYTFCMRLDSLWQRNSAGVKISVILSMCFHLWSTTLDWSDSLHLCMALFLGSLQIMCPLPLNWESQLSLSL